MHYLVCLDTTVLVDLYKSLRTGKKVKGFDELKALVQAKDVTLLVSQVTILELEKFVDNAERELLSTVTRIETAVGNEGEHVKGDLAQTLAEPLKTWRKKKADDMRAVANGIFDWLKTGEPIKFTLEIGHETKCRTIAGKFPESNQKPDKRDQDCFIIDSLISHFGGNIAEKNLLFATIDNGFGKFGDDGTGPLDDTFQKGLPPARIFKDLSKLVTFVNDGKTVTLPTPDEVEAEKKRGIEQELKFEQQATAEVVKSGGKVFEIRVGDTIGVHDHGTTVSISGFSAGGGITFGGMPSTKTARVRPNENNQSLTQDQQYKRWTDPNGVSWRLVFYNHAPMMGDPSLSLTIVLDRASAQYSSGDVSEKCDQYLRTLDFKSG